MPRYIDADALKDELELADFETDSRMFGGQTVLFKDSVFKIVDSAPTISPDEVRGKGKWIRFTRKYIIGVDDEGVHMIRCSVCDYTQFESSKSSTNYCPSCGAKMEVTSDAE